MFLSFGLRFNGLVSLLGAPLRQTGIDERAREPTNRVLPRGLQCVHRSTERKPDCIAPFNYGRLRSL